VFEKVSNTVCCESESFTETKGDRRNQLNNHEKSSEKVRDETVEKLEEKPVEKSDEFCFQGKTYVSCVTGQNV